MTTYPGQWGVDRLGNVATFKAGRTPARANASYWEDADGGVPWVAISDMRPFGNIRATAERITAKAFAEVFSGRTVPAGTLIMSFKLTIGRVATLGVSACHNEAIVAIYPTPAIDRRYLGYFLSQIDYSSLHDRQIKGNTLNREKLTRLPVALPDLTEQVSIAASLDLVRAAVDLERQIGAALEALKRATMHELFTSGLRGERQADTDLGPVPQSWQWTRFAELRDWLQYGTSIKCSAKPSRHPVLRIPNVMAARVDPADLKYCDMEDKAAAVYALETGDLLFVRTNGVLERLGTCAVYEGRPVSALFASYLIRARLKTDRIVPKFAAYFFSSEHGTSLVAGSATPAADGKYNLNTGIIDSLPCPLPPTLSEQEEIVAILDALDLKIEIHKRKRAVLEDLFKSLLHKLMTGEIRVSDLDLSALHLPLPAAQASVGH